LTGCNFNEVRTKTERGTKKKQRANKGNRGETKNTNIANKAEIRGFSGNNLIEI
jgi:hypothetical protein